MRFNATEQQTAMKLVKTKLEEVGSMKLDALIDACSEGEAATKSSVFSAWRRLVEEKAIDWQSDGTVSLNVGGVQMNITEEAVQGAAIELLGDTSADEIDLVKRVSDRTGAAPAMVYQHIQALLDRGAINYVWPGGQLRQGTDDDSALSVPSAAIARL